MDATTIRVREPRELLALLPYQLGFRPRHSAVAVAVRPPRGLLGMIARVDLGDLADPELGPQLARRLVTHLVGDGAVRAVLVVYADEDPRPTSPLGRTPTASRPVPALAAVGPGTRVGGGADRRDALVAVDHFRRAATGFLGDTVPVWVVGPGGYFSLDCRDDDCCPPGGRPLRELESTEVSAHMVLAGAMVADSRETLVPDHAAPGPDRRNASRAAARWHARGLAAEALGPDAVAAWRAAGLATWRVQVRAAERGEGRPGAAVLGRLLAALRDVLVRDAVLLTLVAGTGDLAERSLQPSAAAPGALAGETAAALGAILSTQRGVPPDWQAHDGPFDVLQRLVAHAPGPDRAPALTLLGLLAWWQGDGARAGVLLERAVDAEPGYRLAHLLIDALSAGVAPGWVRGRR